VGRLAGGVAHDFNNMLSAILGYCELLLEEVPPSHPLRSDIEEIRHAGESAASLTRQLLAFSRRQVLKPEVLDPNSVITAMTKILHRTIGEDIDVTTTLAPDVGSVRADRGQLEQVVMNVSVNARDAMPQGGVIQIRTSRTTLPASLTRGRWTIPAGDYVMLEIQDSGCGMTPDVLGHIFEPFFTTKPQGKGTGLGLPSVYGIVTQSGGYIAVESEIGHGTTVAIYLPLVTAATRERAPARQAYQPEHGSETVLVVEDNTVLRALIRRALDACGYRVLAAAGGEEAEKVVAEHGRPIDLLLTDIVMPGISGVELATRMQAARPGLRVLFTSGYTDDSLLDHGFDAGASFLQKPFTPSALLAAVGKTLQQPVAGE
jgi:two-component system cell cycle sensor histidine kinase/response regulator CckA